MFPSVCPLWETRRNIGRKQCFRNNVSATMFPQQCFRNNVSATMFPSLPWA
jgi:hypothetical protein